MLSRIIGACIFKIRKVNNYFLKKYLKSRFRSVGNDVYIGNNGIFTYENIEIGDDVYIGSNAVFQSSYGKISIGNHVMFGPGVHIHGGNHKIYETGKLLKHTSEKKPGDDGVITVEDDCWIGANAIILSGVTVGRGSVIGAGSTVTKSIPPYSVYTGSPAVKLRERFNEDALACHIKNLRGGVTVNALLSWLLLCKGKSAKQKLCSVCHQ